MTGLDPYDAWMRRALWLAERGGGATSPNPMVGCVILDADGEPAGEGWHARAGGPHAEAAALAAAREAGRDVREGTAVVTLEPCAHHGRTPPCAQALIDAGIARVVFADEDPAEGKGGAARLREAGIEAVGGLRRAEARALNEPWLHRTATGRPLVHLKVAHTLSGHVTRGTGKDRWVSSPEARAATHRMRRRTAAILVGIGTALADDPALTVRDWPPPGGPADDPARDDRPWAEVQPLRVVLDTGLRLPLDSNLASTVETAGLLVLGGPEAPAEREAALAAAGAEVARIPAADGGLDLAAAADLLGERGITGVLVEPGPTLARAFLEAGLADRWTALVAPDADVAPDARALYADLPAFRLEDVRTALHGGDVEVSGRPRRV